ncbi:Piso0_000162 [Millerozyma farinosa CBS 7064]|uniref:Piso0_000162 protein n=1 Tax=Pichia sorbitophila (strain ATCC MYA-4447 / BCRC 22081 / CBS 7064 / NBRC 10061 / NRRL Y-12695) TaxID=559304 RepID=G8YUP4_PICSO|nr:Piso0_000162 [Millerozyma farinosa CBS 7064]
MPTVSATIRPSEPPAAVPLLGMGPPACQADARPTPGRHQTMTPRRHGIWRTASAQANEDAAMFARCRSIVTFVIISVPRCTTYTGLRLQRKKKKMLSNDGYNV